MGDGASPHDDPTAGVLICDDNASMRTLLGVIVGSASGLEVVGEAADGDAAILEATRLQPDVILLDLAMPKLSGLDALPELRRVAAGARIVVLSGFAGANVAAEVLALGAATYLEKGAHPDVIVATIEDALAKSAPASLTAPA